jgi:hypothetical protein
VARGLRIGHSANGPLTGLDWDGTAPGRRMLYRDNPPSLYPLTIYQKVFPRNQVTRSPNERYHTYFFHGNRGKFDWGAGYDRSYVGNHPYPIPAPTGDGKWEISTFANDFVTRDDGSSPVVTWGTWHSQAVILSDLGGGSFQEQYLVALPSVTTANKITHTSPGAYVVPPVPSLMFGQAPPHPDFPTVSWGGFAGWEEGNFIWRGWHVHVGAHTESQALQLAACDTDAQVLAKCSELGLSAPWQLLMNPTVSDVTDKSGNGRHFSWDGAFRPDDWTA